VDENQMNIQEIEDDILEVFKSITGQLSFSKPKKEWTKAILLAIGTLGKKHGCHVCGLREHFEPAFLYDLSWYINDAEYRLLDMPLVLESEWSDRYSYIKFDFEKLLIAKSKFKIMVFKASGNKVAEYFNNFEQGIRAYQGGSLGEIYLLACLIEDKWEFEIKRIQGA